MALVFPSNPVLGQIYEAGNEQYYFWNGFAWQAGIASYEQVPLTLQDNIGDEGTAAYRDVAVTGDAAAGEVVLGNDSRLTNARTPVAHTHDDRYYTESEVDTLLTGKSDTTHNHDGTYQPAGSYAAAVHNHDGTYSLTTHDHSGTYAPVSHDHDSQYYTESEVNTLVDYSKVVSSSVAYTVGGTTTFTIDTQEKFFSTTATGNTTIALAFSGSTEIIQCCVIELTNGGAYTINWPAGITWDTGTAPTLTSAGTDVLAFYKRGTSSSIRGMLGIKDVK